MCNGLYGFKAGRLFKTIRICCVAILETNLSFSPEEKHMKLENSWVETVSTY